MPIRTPLAAAGALFAAGILVPAPWRPPALIAGTSSLLLLLGGAALLLIGRAAELHSARASPAGRFLILAAFVPLGIFSASAEALSRPACDIQRLLANDPELFAAGVDIEGVLVADARRRPSPEDGCSLEIALRRVKRAARSEHAAGTVRVGVPPSPGSPVEPCDLGEGTWIRTTASLHLPRSFANPGALDYRAFLEARGIAAVGRSRSARLLHVIAKPGHADEALTFLRRSIARSLARAHGGSEDRGFGGVSLALLLGIREEVPGDWEKILQASGTSHLLAVSGFNVAVIATIVWPVARRIGRSPAGRCALLAGALGLYLVLTGREPSVQRAVLGTLLHLGGVALGRRAAPLNTVGGAALALAAGHPASIHDASFSLTFVAAAALAAFAAEVARRLPGSRFVASAFAVDLVASAATTPLTARLFNRIAPGALAANLAASPLMAFALLTAIAVPPAELLGSALRDAGLPLLPLPRPEAIAWLGARAIDLTLLSCRLTIGIPGLSYLCVTPAAWLTGLALAAAAGAALTSGWPRLRGLLIATWCAATIAISWPGERIVDRPSGLRVTVFDVGQGSSVLIETRAGRRLLVDGGGFARSAFDVGERVVARALLTMGVRRLDAIAASHGHVDHAGGVPSLLAMFEGSEIWVPQGDHAEGGMRSIESRALEARRTLRILRRGMEIAFGGARIEVLHPPDPIEERSRDNRSLVIRILAGGRCLLLPGDIESRAESEIAPLLSTCDLLLVPHHGSRTSSTPVFLNAVLPAWGIVSCGATNRFGHPHAETLERFACARIRLLRTDRDGAIQIDLPASGGGSAERRVSVKRFSAGGWRPAGDRARAEPAAPCPE